MLRALALITLVVLCTGKVLAMPIVRPTTPPSLAVEVVDGEKVYRLPVAPTPLVQSRNIPLTIVDDPVNQWMGGTRLPALVIPPNNAIVAGAVRPGSVVVRPGPEGAPYVAGRDYQVDDKWAGLWRLPEGHVPAGANCFVDYDFYLSRMDTVQIGPSGRPTLRRGKPAVVCPHPAGPAAGAKALANIWVRWGATTITAEDIYPIGRPDPLPAADPALVPKTRALLAAGKPVKIVFLGDSVTCGGDASRPEYAFPALFVTRLSERFPQAQVTGVNAGIGGTNSDLGLQRLDKDVIAHHPDLVVIEFINDFGFPREKILENYRQLVTRLRAGGAEVVILTPHFIWPEWMGGYQAALAALLEAAAANKVAVAHGSARWAALKAQGIPYQTMLVNCINHPDDRGHALFVDALMELFPKE